mmetsp:Transcript_7883/g.23186  ORF Transcript_7883/g.23186 Transcript_7883/m.23186 type:complete len:225 (+) Transcript_7883:487-1161(+)
MAARYRPPPRQGEQEMHELEKLFSQRPRLPLKMPGFHRRLWGGPAPSGIHTGSPRRFGRQQRKSPGRRMDSRRDGPPEDARSRKRRARKSLAAAPGDRDGPRIVRGDWGLGRQSRPKHCGPECRTDSRNGYAWQGHRLFHQKDETGTQNPVHGVHHEGKPSHKHSRHSRNLGTRLRWISGLFDSGRSATAGNFSPSRRARRIQQHVAKGSIDLEICWHPLPGRL